MKASGRSRRLAAIIGIVEREPVSGQDQLLKLLKTEGYDVTQATLSRDINELKIVKMPDGQGGYRYSRHAVEAGRQNLLPASGLVSVEISGQMGVLRTRPGYASVMAAGIDDARLPNVMGTIAGDDTVLVLLRKEAVPEAVLADLQRLLPDAVGKLM